MTALDHSCRNQSMPQSANAATDHVTIVLAAFNGAAVIDAQLASIAEQTHRNWSLIVSDDGSTDATRDKVRAFAGAMSRHRVTLLRGPGRGSAQNFLSLLRAAGSTPFLAFCDQDDVWFRNKLERALAALDGAEQPAIYGTRTQIADADLTPLRSSMAFRRAPGFGNALVQNIAGGNTMVLNRAALDVLQPASLMADRIIAHDWWAYQVVTGCGGAVLFEGEPSLLYRQHGANQIGSNDGPAAAFTRARSLANGTFSDWMGAHLAALEAADRWLTAEARRQVAALSRARQAPLAARLRLSLQAGIYRQTRRGSLALWIAILCGRL